MQSMNKLVSKSEQSLSEKCGGLAAPLSEVFAIQDILEKYFLPADMPVTHHFAPGLYLREIYMKAGTRVVGKMHKTTHLNIITKGDVSVMTRFGKHRITVTDKPIVFLSQPGVKKVLYIHEDTVWMTPHVTEETDLERLEEELIVPESELRDDDGNLLMGDRQLDLFAGEMS